MRLSLKDVGLLKKTGFRSFGFHQAILRLLSDLCFVMAARTHRAPGDCLGGRWHSLQSAHRIPLLQKGVRRGHGI